MPDSFLVYYPKLSECSYISFVVESNNSHGYFNGYIYYNPTDSQLSSSTNKIRPANEYI